MSLSIPLYVPPGIDNLAYGGYLAWCFSKNASGIGKMGNQMDFGKISSGKMVN